MDLQNLLDDIAGSASSNFARGEVASHIIPQLGYSTPNRFGISVATTKGEVYSAGDAGIPFSIQSISKVFALALALQRDSDSLWKRVSREPSGSPFNSLVQLEQESGIPRNPFINAGALIVTDTLLSAHGPNHEVLNLLRSESGNPEIRVDTAIADSEMTHSHRNYSLGYFLATYGNLHNDARDVVDAYVRQCAISASCLDLATASQFLASNGRGRSGSFVTSALQTRRINALMATCGTYDAAGEFAYRVGLPGKSGIGGGIVAVVPSVCSICVWSPRLGTSGNSIAGVAALSELTAATGWSIF